VGRPQAGGEEDFAEFRSGGGAGNVRVENEPRQAKLCPGGYSAVVRRGLVPIALRRSEPDPPEFFSTLPVMGESVTVSAREGCQDPARRRSPPS